MVTITTVEIIDRELINPRPVFWIKKKSNNLTKLFD